MSAAATVAGLLAGLEAPDAPGVLAAGAAQSAGEILDAVREGARWTLMAISAIVLVYSVSINTSYLLLIFLATWDAVHHHRRVSFSTEEDLYSNPLTPPVTVIMPAYNEEAGIAEAVRSMLSMRYPTFEVIVVDDGSKDGTFERLREEHNLVELPRVVPDDIPMRGTVLSTHVPANGSTPLLVIRKTNSGRADALNVGINFARHPLVCMVDADSLLDPSALLLVAKPFADDPMNVVATGGVVRIVNDCDVVGGRVARVRMPRRWLVRIQVMEYLRAFLLGRTGWSRLGGLLIISGAFGLFRRDVLVEVGGLDPDSIGEDAELVTRLHRYLREGGRDYRIVFVSEPVSWTEAPSSAAVLARQRRRWSRGLAELLWKHRTMIANPRYGRIGVLTLPYFVLFELLAPVVNLGGVALVPIALWAGAINMDFALALLVASFGYAVLVGFVALAVEEYAFRRYNSWRDLGVAAVASVAENFGYRQFNAWWGLQGIFAALRRTKQVWGVMTREGFSTPGRPAGGKKG
ncbi:glycosyl transferase family 2 [Planobispora rosea]|uniref:Glycosyl transferase family 2 n=1 Tax=Planobispora rosea TaxID=35762 RepID=A0A8J3WH24_PLARO|nr:glycosyltransferase [Planobispora rosea]GGS86246.1 glycosyl transferase family 2 [Planobispora rosea]GIH89028.1 glycosyl transferase family 2 [Planobispora rosea]